MTRLQGPFHRGELTKTWFESAGSSFSYAMFCSHFDGPIDRKQTWEEKITQRYAESLGTQRVLMWWHSKMTSCESTWKSKRSIYRQTTRKFAGAKEIKSRLGKVITRRGCTQGKTKMGLDEPTENTDGITMEVLYRCLLHKLTLAHRDHNHIHTWRWARKIGDNKDTYPLFSGKWEVF